MNPLKLLNPETMDPDPGLDRQENVIPWSLGHVLPSKNFVKISS